MAIKRYGISKQESNRLNQLLMVAEIQKELWEAIQEKYKVYLTGTVFKRLGLGPDLFKASKIDLGNGEVLVDVPDKGDKSEQKEKAKVS